MKHLLLYTGPQCSLCTQAKALIEALPEPIALEQVNIRDDHKLYHLYGARIPVIKRKDTGSELGWPFDLLQLQEFMQ